MNNFTFYNPTRIHFGRGQLQHLSKEIPLDAKILLVYGETSIKNNGIYSLIKQQLQHHQIVEFPGIKPNPELEYLLKGVALTHRENCEFILAVGGGSVIDGSKFIAAASHFKGDPWDILLKHRPITSAIPLGTVLTLPATGSEMNGSSVVSNTRLQQKLYFSNNLVMPTFSICDPELTYSVPKKQVSNGLIDAFTHVMEQYLTYPTNALLTDRFSESILRTLIEVGPKTLDQPTDYDARSNFMWCTTMALNGLICCGVPEDWATHMIGHELTALYGLDHGETLAILLPAVMRYKREQKKEKLLQFGQRVWHLEASNPEDCIDQTITRTEQFFNQLGLRTRLSQYSINKDCFANVSTLLSNRPGGLPLGEHRDIWADDVEAILNLAF